MKILNVGILAHVDAGKTTLSESLLFESGMIRRLGRVDHKDAFLDTYALEKERGITIFSKQARLLCDDAQITLLDTPGHVDFSAEMERTLQVLDYAILVISGSDGVQGHTMTLWRLLERYHIPAFLFVNKMDQPGTDKGKLLEELKSRLSDSCIDFTDAGTDEFYEEIAMTDEDAMEQVLESGMLEDERISDLIADRKVFPVFFGSALKMEGVGKFLHSLALYAREPVYGPLFAARVYKISRDDSGTRQTFLKVTGGTLKVKDLITGMYKGGSGIAYTGGSADMPDLTAGEDPVEEETWSDKVDQIRLYSGTKYETRDEVKAGMVCAVTGLEHTWPGQGLGQEQGGTVPMLEPVLNYRILLPEGSDVHQVWLKLRQLEEEDPMLHIIWEKNLGEIHAQVMGEVQIEILKNEIKERFGLEVAFGSGSIVYKETIGSVTEGVGHFEPLRHYAEVHLIMEPGDRNSGITVRSIVNEDDLDLNWQRLIMTHVLERTHAGVLTGAPLTDVKVTVCAGRAHLKHTEGGDFRQAVYRAVRQGLMKAENILLEPFYDFRLEVPPANVGRAIGDIQKMSGTFDDPCQDGEYTVITGKAPASTMRNYQTEVAAYTRGTGHLTLLPAGYEPCHNAEEIIAEKAYDPTLDFANPTGSVFCSHGAGFYVPWEEVEDYMHLPMTLTPADTMDEEDYEAYIKEQMRLEKERKSHPYGQSDRELEEIFTRTYGAVKKRIGEDAYSDARSNRAYALRREAIANGTYVEPKDRIPERYRKNHSRPKPEEYLLVDGYNIIFSWDELNAMAQNNLAGARGTLMDILSNYQGYRKMILILVFDAYKVAGGQEKVYTYHNIHVVFTKEAETADQYIEKTVHRMGPDRQVTVASSDGLEQVIILGAGARRMSARELKEEIERSDEELRQEHTDRPVISRSTTSLLERFPEEMKKTLEDMRS